MTLQDQPPPGDASRLSGRLWVAVRRFDDVLASSVLSRAFAMLPPGDVADRVVVPVLRRLGESWQDDPRVVAAEHFTSSLVRARFSAHSSGGAPDGPLAVCFTPAGDQHDLGLHLAAAVLVVDGWRTRFLGADTPPASARSTVAELSPGLVLVGACMRSAAEDFLTSDVAGGRPVVAGGAGFLPGDTDEAAGLVVHHGPFASVPAVARRLLERADAGGAPTAR